MLYGFVSDIIFDNLIKIIYHDKLKSIPKILETPYVDKEYAPYREEMIRSKKFNENLLNEVRRIKK